MAYKLLIVAITMPRVSCTHCGRSIEFPEELTGQESACPGCGSAVKLGGGAFRVRIPEARPRASGPGGAVGPAPAGTAISGVAGRLIENIEKVIVGKRSSVVLVLAAYLSEGHVLLEDVPGVAKTMLARAIAKSVGGSFKRIQCTPDLLPNDVTGASIFNPKTTEFEFRSGPLFAQFVLADEINRTTPRTQSALLEAMSERQVTIDGACYGLERPFFIIATQNPVDHEGTFPLPEAQLDRFLLKLSLGYPGLEEESRMIDLLQHEHPIETLEAVVDLSEVLECQKQVRRMAVDPKVRDYVVALVRATREHHSVLLGASPRASLALFRASQALAALQGYEFVLPDHVKEMAHAVLGHRVIVRPENRLRKVTSKTVVSEILNQVPVPVLE